MHSSFVVREALVKQPAQEYLLRQLIVKIKQKTAKPVINVNRVFHSMKEHP